MNHEKFRILRQVFREYTGLPENFNKTKSLREFGLSEARILELTAIIGEELAIKIHYFEINGESTFDDICHYLGTTFISCMDKEAQAFVEEKQLC